MTISTQNNRITAAGNGATVDFAFPNKFLLDGDLTVFTYVTATKVITLQVLTTNYTVAGKGADTGGTVTMVVPPPTGTTLIIFNDPDKTQLTNFVENDDIPNEEIEKNDDRAVILTQRIKDQLSRAIILNDGYAGAFNPIMPEPQASSILVANAGLTAFDWESRTDFLAGLTGAFFIENEGALVGSFNRLNLIGADINAVDVGGDTASVTIEQINLQGTEAAPQNIVAGTGIVFAATRLHSVAFIQGSGGDVDISVSPQITAGTRIGQMLTLIGRNDAQTVQFDNGNGLALNGVAVLGANEILRLIWSGTVWLELGRNS